MPRIAAFLIFACWIASVSGIASTQPIDLPRCNPKQAEMVLHEGGFPDFSGCRWSDAAKVLARYDYRVREVVDESVTGVPQGLVTRQSQDDGVVTLSVSTGRGYPPALAMQLCPDGSRIPATETCPAPPIMAPVVAPAPVIPAAVQPAPPPPPPPAVNHDPTPPADSDCYQYQMAMFRPPRFTISAPAEVHEGDSLTLTIHRDAKECRPHKIGLSYDHAELLAEQPTSIEFPASAQQNAEQTVAIATAKGPAGDGDQSVTISLKTGKDAAVGDPGSVTVRILDAPPATTPVSTATTTATTYVIVVPVRAERGQSLTFRVDKTGPTSVSELDYDVRQGNEVISPDGLPHPLRFAAGEISKSLTLTADFYSVCSPPPTLTLHDGSGRDISATASFSVPSPDTCGPEVPWLAIAAGLLGLGAIAFAIHTIFPPVPKLYPSWDIEAGAPIPPASLPRIPGWPRFSTQVDLEWGGASVPEPLPIAETNDG
ncbi:PASTA domain-containing protein [Sphingomonas sp. URHD0057]|uniref:PASTA domain-containing protein n=1 Tax=Sphingomonas sp. URHD0057 TaxID=1380389 RepID=UPI00049161DD|nr:PASTA domain-containing protein [Sphingomonas sp. URHD0057]